MFSYEGEKIGQGKENAKEYLKTHPEFCEEVESLILEKVKQNPNEIVLGTDEDE